MFLWQANETNILSPYDPSAQNISAADLTLERMVSSESAVGKYFMPETTNTAKFKS